MILLYTMLVLVLGLVKVLVGLRARALERKYMAVSTALDEMLREANVKPGSGKSDLCLVAKRTVVLGELVQDRDRVEVKYFSWQRWSDRFANWVRALRDWQGKKLPYTFGAVDVWMVLTLVDYLGVGQYCSMIALIDAVLLWWNK